MGHLDKDLVTVEKLRIMLARELEQAAGNDKLSGLIDDCGIQDEPHPSSPQRANLIVGNRESVA